MEKQSKEIEKLTAQISKKQQEIVKLTRRKRTGEAQRAQDELDKLRQGLDSRRREMARRFR